LRSLKLGVLVSGGGTNLQSIIDHIESGYLASQIAVVISSHDGAYALERAKRHNIPHFTVKSKNYSTVQEYEEEMIKILKNHNVDLVILAGFIKVLSPHFVKAFPNRIMNIHPSLIPSFCGDGFYGEKVHRAVLNYGVKITGVTVHFVDEGTDTGPIILQRAVPVKDDDTPQSLAQRVLEQEHAIYPEAIKLYEQDLITIKGRRVLLKKRRNRR
jgi:phosphoribosylglycinamide formyltransferase-1